MRTGNPTNPLIVRSDGWGSGKFGAPRGTHPGGSAKFHDGLDVQVQGAGDLLHSIIDGKMVKIDYPYRRDLSWTGLQQENKLVRVEYWYMTPAPDLVGETVTVGTVIGVSQDISQKYGEHEKYGIMLPHIHIRVTLFPFTTLIGGIFAGSEVIIDPELLIGA